MSDDMSNYLQVFLDETDEELESLVESLLILEDNPTEVDALNEAFRLLHSLKGSSGMMGYENISEFAHELENRFEAFRSGDAVLDHRTTSVMLECVDFLRNFSSELRNGKTTKDDGAHLIRRLEQIEESSPETENSTSIPLTLGNDSDDENEDSYHVRVVFEQGLQLADLKARLIVARLSDIGEIISSEPPVDEIQSFETLPQFVVVLRTERDQIEIGEIANVDGVESIEILHKPQTDSTDIDSSSPTPLNTPTVDLSRTLPDVDIRTHATASGRIDETDETSPRPLVGGQEIDDTESEEVSPVVPQKRQSEPERTKTDDDSSDAASRRKVAETVRVDIDRLDRLMNLTGELVITRARFDQITREMNPILRNSHVSNQAKDMCERLRMGLQKLHAISTERSAETEASKHILREIEDDLNNLEEQSLAWEESRKQFGQVTEAVDQLSRVSDKLQKGVLDTRMVPVAPLFNRFKRVIRDLSFERGKKVQLVIRGEKTELDKRMIDELGDPLLHLVRNSIDHGLESPEERLRQGKPETGTINLSASHSGNNVFITIEDDGAGLNIDRIRARIAERGLATESGLSEMSQQQVIEHIWHPGFSTADQVTDISGRGVGMDIVKKRIMDLNGAIEIESTPAKGARFKIRLPLTLAIIRSLLVRFLDGVFSIPIDDVREIVSVPSDQIYTVQTHQTIDVRGEFIPLVGMASVFAWKGDDHRKAADKDAEQTGKNPAREINVVILQSLGRTLGLAVDELLGGAYIVVKSLSDNFISIRGLSGASVMGDGTVSLMLDASTVIEMATDRSTNQGSQNV